MVTKTIRIRQPPVYYPRHYPAPKKTARSMTSMLIWANIIFFLLVISLVPFLGEEKFEAFFRDNIALTPSTFFNHPWTILTSMFMHAPGAVLMVFSAHLLVNMISLFFLGSLLERIIGRKRFLFVYFAGGIAGGLFMILLSLISNDPRIVSLTLFANPAMKAAADISAVGASAAIFAVAGCLAVLIPRMPVLVFFLIPMKLWHGIIFLMFVLAAFPGIANSAHLGGMLVGLLFAFYLRKKYKKKVAMLNRYLGLEK